MNGRAPDDIEGVKSGSISSANITLNLKDTHAQNQIVHQRVSNVKVATALLAFAGSKRR